MEGLIVNEQARTELGIVQRMRNVLLEQGWTQGTLKGQDGQVCLLGSYLVAEDLPRANWIESSGELNQILAPELQAASIGVCVTSAWVFNDIIAKSFNDIIDLLDQAEIRLKEQL